MVDGTNYLASLWRPLVNTLSRSSIFRHAVALELETSVDVNLITLASNFVINSFEMILTQGTLGGTVSPLWGAHRLLAGARAYRRKARDTLFCCSR